MKIELAQRTWWPFGFTAGIAALLIVAGCQDYVSIYPFYTEKDLVFEPALVGFWTEAGETNLDVKAEFKRAGDKKYSLTIHSVNATNATPTTETNAAEVCLFKLKGQCYMDWDTPAGEKDGPEIPRHKVWKVSRLDSTLEMAGLEYDWLREFLKQNPAALRHYLKTPASTNCDIILTADTRELQRFLGKHAGTPGAFSTNVLRLVRQERGAM